MSKFKEQVTRRGVYVLPSFFTTMGLFAGFYALIAAIQGRFELAAWAILAAAVFDMLDGRVARLLHAESAFGAEYDSLCDMLSFGVAPAVLLYLWGLVNMGPNMHQLAWLGSFFLVACAALRLARFNVQLECQDKRYFQGLPTPAAALLIASAVLFYLDVDREPSPWLWFAVSVFLSWMMVSGVRFFSGKDIDLKRQRSSAILVVIIIAICLVALSPYQILFVIFALYCLHGPLLNMWQSRRITLYRRQRMLRRKAKKTDKNE